MSRGWAAARCFATHYHELTELEQTLPRVKNYHMAAVEQDQSVVFLHELRRGGADRSYGIHVAQLAGIPRTVIRRAGELLAELERGVRGAGNKEQGTSSSAPTPRSQPPSPASLACSTLRESTDRDVAADECQRADAAGGADKAIRASEAGKAINRVTSDKWRVTSYDTQNSLLATCCWYLSL